ncbi:signal peptidase II [Lujinxingia litoralis]|uniref:Lipoprotein signal peptidase n=1 Tax=Lujinxingia litoralis TaxID=2211119 RepID=A0A328C5S4_9DELT|nr:signal peptidase II [Lujinxingia litoralis]RAL22182.1 signal peptidase II [Lujinxingia litoralis]
MKSQSMWKYGLFAMIVVIGVALDQWSKWYAESWLATERPGFFSHPIVLEVPQEAEGTTVEEYLGQTFEANSPEEVKAMAQLYTRTEDGVHLRPETELEAGQIIEVTNRDVTVIEGYWDFQYTRNPGAAFGLFADKDSEFRKPFFLGVSLLAVLIILGLLRGVQNDQKLLLWALALIAGGALGNFIDRVRYGYVTDFIVWKYTDVYRWPTFNVADALICVGVAFMVIEMIRDMLRERNQAGEAIEIEAQA